MYVVIFKAIASEVDEQYAQVASRLRDMTLSKYGCVEFVSLTEGDKEIALSYWCSLEHVAQWKKNSEHVIAQEFGKSKWYSSYQVQVAKIVREYEKLE